MNIFAFFRRAFAYLTLHVGEGEGGGEPSPEPIAAPEPIAQEPAAPPAEPAAPKTMLDAISQALQPRDEQGRFAAKVKEEADAAAKLAESKPEADPTKPAQPQVPPPAKPTDPHGMPEGLKPEAQQRFRTLVAERNQFEQRADMAERQVAHVKEAFQTNGIRPEQFEGLMAFAGAFNKGDYQSALQLVDQIRGQIAMAMGQALPGVDVGQQLTPFPDLRQAVDNLQIDQGRALEIANARMREQAAREMQVEQQRQQQTQAQERQQFEQGIMAVDAWTKKMRGEDIDYAAFEEKFLPHVQSVLRAVPPAQWASTIDAHYRMMKGFIATPRPQQANGQTLRPAGSGASKQAPRTPYEAMWGTPQPTQA